MDGRSILIVDDDPSILRTVARALQCHFATVMTAASLEAALACMQAGVDVIVTDVVLDGDSGLDVARAAMRMAPKPIVIAVSGQAEPLDAFELGRAGVRSYLQKPFTPDELLRKIDERPDGAAADVRDLVGKARLSAVSEAVKVAMVEEALAQSEGNKSQAARLLGINRQHLQHILKRRPAGK